MTMWGNDQQRRLFEEIAAEFVASDPEVTKVQIIQTPTEYRERLLVMLAGGTAPDVAFLDGENSKDFFAAGLMRELDSYIARDGFDVSDFFEPFWDAATFDGKRYGLPIWGGGFRTDLYAINRNLFEAVGLPLPYFGSDPDAEAWTNDEFLAAVRKLTRDTSGDGNPDTWGFVPGRWYAWVYSNGGSVFSQDRTRGLLHEQAAAEALQFLADLRVEGQTSTQANFFQGRVGIAQVLYPNIGLFKERIGTSFDWQLAHQPKGAAGSIGYAKLNTISIPREAPHPDASWRLIKHMTSPRTATIMAENYVSAPWLRSVALSADFLYSDEPPYDVSPNIFGETLPVPNLTGWTEIRGAWDAALQSVNSGARPASVVLEEVRGQIDAKLQEMAARGPIF